MVDEILLPLVQSRLLELGLFPGSMFSQKRGTTSKVALVLSVDTSAERPIISVLYTLPGKFSMESFTICESDRPFSIGWSRVV